MYTVLKYFGALSVCGALATSSAFVADSVAQVAHDKYTLKGTGRPRVRGVQGIRKLAGVSLSANDKAVALILGNPAMIAAYRAGIPGNGKPFPDGARLAKIHLIPTKQQYFPATTVPGAQHDVDFMVKDSKRFADSGGWGYATFDYDAASGTFTPGTLADTPPQANDAKCGAACHTIVKGKDYVFTDYASRLNWPVPGETAATRYIDRIRAEALRIRRSGVVNALTIQSEYWFVSP